MSAAQCDNAAAPSRAAPSQPNSCIARVPLVPSRPLDHPLLLYQVAPASRSNYSHGVRGASSAAFGSTAAASAALGSAMNGRISRVASEQSRSSHSQQQQASNDVGSHNGSSKEMLTRTLWPGLVGHSGTLPQTSPLIGATSGAALGSTWPLARPLHASDLAASTLPGTSASFSGVERLHARRFSP